MNKNLKTIYEYFNSYTEEKINNVISSLSDEEKELITLRYGSDLHNPQTDEKISKDKYKKFYGNLIPKIRRLLEKETIMKENVPTIEKTEKKIILPSSKITNEHINYTPLLLKLLKEGQTNTEICTKLNINQQQLYEELLSLKNKGLMCARKYYSDGSIKYNSIFTMQELKNNNVHGQDRTIITDINENTVKTLLISDLHFGNELERLDLINRAYNYCIKNGINIILCGGDFIDGAYTKGTQTISDLYQQVEYFIKNYPYDKSILTFGVAGDHDISVFNNSSLDILEMCNNFRHDIIIGGYNNAGINLKNDKIHLYHHIESGTIRQTDAPIILHGHSHKYLTEIKNNSLNITIPTLSGIAQPMPSALELDITFSKGYIDSSTIKHIYFGEQDIILSESNFDLSKERNDNYESIKNVENFQQKLIQESNEEKSLIKTRQKLSQTEKFYKRYGK